MLKTMLSTSVILFCVIGIEAPMRKRPYRRRASTSADPIAEPLSNRELDVLRLLATGRSTREIARALVLAESTVKMHLKHLYSKLSVHNRVQAITQAQTRQLLE
jgi:ATP/maltotriose-dependent transcriptional regulator MalT